MRGIPIAYRNMLNLRNSRELARLVSAQAAVENKTTHTIYRKLARYRSNVITRSGAPRRVRNQQLKEVRP